MGSYEQSKSNTETVGSNIDRTPKDPVEEREKPALIGEIDQQGNVKKA